MTEETTYPGSTRCPRCGKSKTPVSDLCRQCSNDDRRNTNTERDRIIASKVAQGAQVQEIVKEYGMTRARVYQILKRYHVQPVKSVETGHTVTLHITSEEAEKLIKLTKANTLVDAVLKAMSEYQDHPHETPA